MIGSRGLAIVQEDLRNAAAAALPWDRLSGATVAVTGASGFIGSYLVRFLLSLHAAGKVDRPISVVALVRDRSKAMQRFSDLAASPALRIEVVDMCAPQGLQVRADWFIHAASLASPKQYSGNPLGTLAPNVIGTWHLLQQARESQARGFLFVSSSEVYGSPDGSASLGEEAYGRLDPTSVRSAYAESKRMGETMCVAAMHQFSLPVFLVRPFHTYGPGVSLDDGRVFADFAADVVAGRDIQLTSDGSARRAFCYISDALSGFFTVLLRGEPGQAYNVANPAGDLSMLELAKLMVGLPQAKPGLQASVNAAPAAGYLRSPHAHVLPSVQKLEGLGWKPVVTPADGFRRMLESYA